MGLFTKDIKSMEDLFLHTLQDVYYAENQIVKALPKMIDKSTNRELAAGLRNHLRETETQVTRLQQVFERLGQEPKGVDCPAIDGLIKEADEVAGEVDDKKVLDAAIIGSAQAVEHYEISRYGTLIAWAEEAWARQRGEPAQCQSQRREGCRQEAQHAGRRRCQQARQRSYRRQAQHAVVPTQQAGGRAGDKQQAYWQGQASHARRALIAFSSSYRCTSNDSSRSRDKRKRGPDRSPARRISVR